jgi:MFS family permease
LGFFLPTIINGMGNQSITNVGYLVAIPYIAAFAGLILVGRSSGKKNERKWHAFFSLAVGAIGLGLSIMVYPNLVLSMTMFTIATVGIYSAFGPFWSLPTIFLTETSAAASIGLINSIGNLGGFIGPFIVGYLKTSTDSYNSGSIFLVVSLLVAAFLLLALKKTKDLT